MNFNSKMKFYQDYFNDSLDNFLINLKSKLDDGMYDLISYPLLNGGKRVRPILCFATAETLGVSLEKVKNFALAIEMIHCYSLVHDDLPAMDNDDFRRGKPSTHKMFGEANGILSGDALLNLAIETCLEGELSNCELNAVREIFACSGAKGMILGQYFDLKDVKPNTKEYLYSIYENKTAKLIMAPVLSASRVAGDKYYNDLKEFSYNLGVLFQITDDLLDLFGTLEQIGKTPNKDQADNKLTAITVYGVDGAKEKENYHFDNCIKSLDNIPNAEFLKEFTKIVKNRKS